MPTGLGTQDYFLGQKKKRFGISSTASSASTIPQDVRGPYDPDPSQDLYVDPVPPEQYGQQQTGPGWQSGGSMFLDLLGGGMTSDFGENPADPQGGFNFINPPMGGGEFWEGGSIQNMSDLAAWYNDYTSQFGAYDYGTEGEHVQGANTPNLSFMDWFQQYFMGSGQAWGNNNTMYNITDVYDPTDPSSSPWWINPDDPSDQGSWADWYFSHQDHLGPGSGIWGTQFDDSYGGWQNEYDTQVGGNFFTQSGGGTIGGQGDLGTGNVFIGGGMGNVAAGGGMYGQDCASLGPQFNSAGECIACCESQYAGTGFYGDPGSEPGEGGGGVVDPDIDTDCYDQYIAMQDVGGGSAMDFEEFSGLYC